MPGVIIYYDMGCTDNLDHQLNWDQMYNSAGVALCAHLNLKIIDLDLGFSYNFFFNDQSESLSLLAYLQF